MRLWDYRLLKALPDRFIVAEWRECIAIKRQWEKGTLKHRLVSYVMDYDRQYFYKYVGDLCNEMINRDINYQVKYFDEISNFCGVNIFNVAFQKLDHYPEHNNRYLRQCISNLEEKFDRGIISREEWVKIIDYYKEILEGKR